MYEPSELVMVAKAGTPLKTITDLLDQNGQELAFEPIDHGPLYGGASQAGTIGGLVAVNACGPRRIKAGAARDHLLGFRAVNGRAEVFQSGGRVMKNVTGYDMSKLMAGSFGTLGIFSEVILKVLPKAETEATLAITGLDEAAAVSLMTLASGLPQDISALAHLPETARTGLGAALAGGIAAGPVTLLRVEGPDVSVRQRIDDIARLAAAHTTELKAGGGVTTETLDQAASARLWAGLRDALPVAGGTTQVWRVSTTPTEGAAVVASIMAADVPVATHFYDWAGGLIWLAVEAAPHAHAAVIRTAVGRHGGHATLVRADDAVRADVAVFQPQPDALAALNARVKRGFDPELILNRGRMRGDL
jgi:glycolate oxidase FAD binding subunit